MRTCGVIRLQVIGLALLACSACAAKRFTCDKPPPFYLRLEATDSVNRDERGRSMPTVVQILQLESESLADHASFDSLWNKPKETLENQLLQVTEFIIEPGQTLERWIPRDPKTRFIMAMGLFRQPLNKAWRTRTILPDVRENQCVEQPAGERGPPSALDEQLRFKLQGHQIDFVSTTPQANTHPPTQDGRKS